MATILFSNALNVTNTWCCVSVINLVLYLVRVQHFLAKTLYTVIVVIKLLNFSKERLHISAIVVASLSMILTLVCGNIAHLDVFKSL